MRCTCRRSSTTRHAQREELDALQYELVHNLVLETTRLGIQVKNLKMQVDSMSSRLDFDERRARALEGVVQYRPGAVAPLQPPASGPRDPRDTRDDAGAERRTRRRRRRGRRPGSPREAGDSRRRGRRRPGRRAQGRERRASAVRMPAAVKADLSRRSRMRSAAAKADEARRRRPALRRGHQWRRRAARTLHRGTARAPRAGRSRDHLRP